MAFPRYRNSLKSKVFFFQAKGYSVLTFWPPTFSHMFEMALINSKLHGKYTEGSFCFGVSCLFQSCSLVRDLFNNGISGLPEALKSRDYIFAMALHNSNFRKEVSCFFGARCLFYSRSLVRVYFINGISGLPEVSQFSEV